MSDKEPNVSTPEGRAEQARLDEAKWAEIQAITPFDAETGERAPHSSWFRETPEAAEMLAEEVAELEKFDRPPVTLVEFLLARIAEDANNGTTLSGVERKDWTARWMTECASKRSIVAAAQFIAIKTHREAGVPTGSTGLAGDLADVVLTRLALPYADHPDYREEWKP